MDAIEDRSFAAPSPLSITKYHDILVADAESENLTGMKIGLIMESFKVAVFNPRVKQCFLMPVRAIAE